MANQSPNVIMALIGSKKVLMAMGSIICLIAVRLGGLTEEAASELSQQIMIIATGYMGGQGIADAGRGIGSGMAARSK